MKRKLINYEVFQKINNESLSKSEQELIEAEEVLAKALGEKSLSLHCFDESSVTYETPDLSYVHASYNLDGKNLSFDNIEELVIDESSANNKSKQILGKMFDDLLKENEASATAAFKEYISLPFVRRSFAEGTEVCVDEKKKKKGKGMPPWLAKKKKKGDTEMPDKDAKKEDAKKKFGGAKVKFKFKPAMKRKLKEWSHISENVMNYVDYQEFGPTVRNSEVKRDDNGNVVALRIPNSHARNEGKILSFNWKTLNTDVMVLRAKMKNLAEDTNFCKAMADLRKCNAVSDNNRLEGILEAVVVRWPNCLYLTQSELAEAIGRALETIGETAYDDQTCEFMAEGILRTAANAYEERVNRIINISGVKMEASNDGYLDFQRIVEQFYKFLDENTKLEMQVYVDLYNTLVEVYKVANEEGNEFLMGEASGYLRELKAVVEQTEAPTLDLASDVATWLSTLVETNLESEEWKVSNDPYITTNGDNPEMFKKAKVGYSPASDFSGNWGDAAPVSDGKSYKGGLADEMRSSSWGNWSNDSTYPSLENPYVPKAGNWTMKGEQGADKGGTDDWSRYQSKDTWPELDNPYLLKSVTPQSYKAKSDDLVVDK